MESAIRSRSTAAADGADDGHRSRLNHNHHPPPPHGDGADLAALSLRREVLLQELYSKHILLDVLTRDLAETERAIAIATGSYRSSPTAVMAPSPRLPERHAWRGTLSAVASSRDEQLLRENKSTANPWWARSPSEPPPVYPHVERSPSPVHGSAETQQQERRGSSSAPPPAVPPTVVRPGCMPPLMPVQESLMPAFTITNPVAIPTEHQAEGKKSNGDVQVMESGIQTSEQPAEHAAVHGKEPKTWAMDVHAVQLMEIQSSVPSKPAEPTKDKPQLPDDEHKMTLVPRIPPDAKRPKLEEPMAGNMDVQLVKEGEIQSSVVPSKPAEPTTELGRSPGQSTLEVGAKRTLEPRIPPAPQAKRPKPEERFRPVLPAIFRRNNLVPRREAQVHRPPQPLLQIKPAEPATESSHGAVQYHQQSSVEKKSQNQNVVPGASARDSRPSQYSGDAGQSRGSSGFGPRSRGVPGRRPQYQSAVVAGSSSQAHAGGGGGGEGQLRKTTPATKKMSMQHVCEMCRVQCTSVKTLQDHFSGKKHREMTLQERYGS